MPSALVDRIKRPALLILLSRHIKQIFLYLCQINNDELETFWEADIYIKETNLPQIYHKSFRVAFIGLVLTAGMLSLCGMEGKNLEINIRFNSSKF